MRYTSAGLINYYQLAYESMGNTGPPLSGLPGTKFKAAGNAACAETVWAGLFNFLPPVTKMSAWGLGGIL
jgi:hypothetical protein